MQLESMIAHINVIEASGSLNPMIFERGKHHRFHLMSTD